MSFDLEVIGNDVEVTNHEIYFGITSSDDNADTEDGFTVDNWKMDYLHFSIIQKEDEDTFFVVDWFDKKISPAISEYDKCDDYIAKIASTRFKKMNEVTLNKKYFSGILRSSLDEDEDGMSSIIDKKGGEILFFDYGHEEPVIDIGYQNCIFCLTSSRPSKVCDGVVIEEDGSKFQPGSTLIDKFKSALYTEELSLFGN